MTTTEKLNHSRLCAPPPNMTFSLCLSSEYLGVRTLVIGLRACLCNPGWFHFETLNYIAKTLFPNKVTFIGFWCSDMDHHSSQYKVKETRFWGCRKASFSWSGEKETRWAGKGLILLQCCCYPPWKCSACNASSARGKDCGSLTGPGFAGPRCLDLASHPLSLSSPCDPMSGFLPWALPFPFFFPCQVFSLVFCFPLKWSPHHEW